MNYADIIKQNCMSIRPSWWPRYAYHLTDVVNVVSILYADCLYSRVEASAKGVMHNDNASRQVIDMTESQTTAYARFYFRPLTPTQFHNEGYKHRMLRYMGDDNANIPVPVFLLFDLEKLLSMDETRFSALSQAGHGSQLFAGADAFSQLPFDKIYSSGVTSDDTWRYRHAEILYPNACPIHGLLKYILCRNECEKATLLHLLKAHDLKTFYRYKDIIRVAKEDTFQRNGLFVESVTFDGQSICFTFANTPEKERYAHRYMTQALTPLRATFLFEWKSAKDVIQSALRDVSIDYLTAHSVTFRNLPCIPGAKTLRVTLRINEQLICVFEQPISAYELI